jgi:uncharacterized protein (DUF302 family)
MAAVRANCRPHKEARRAFLGRLAVSAYTGVALLLQNFHWASAENGETAMSDNGLITFPSAHSFDDTVGRIEADIKSKNLTMFARVDHAAGAKEVGMPLRPTLLLIFGDAKGGTPLMQAKQQVGIDLPLKILVWQDSAGKTWLTYNDPNWIAQRHGLGQDVEPTVKALSRAMAAISKQATT